MTESKGALFFGAIMPSFIRLHTHTHTHRSSPPGLTMATQPRAGTLSLTAERWLKSCEVRFCSRNACTCWMALDTGCRRVVRTA